MNISFKDKTVLITGAAKLASGKKLA